MNKIISSLVSNVYLIILITSVVVSRYSETIALGILAIFAPIAIGHVIYLIKAEVKALKRMGKRKFYRPVVVLYYIRKDDIYKLRKWYNTTGRNFHFSDMHKTIQAFIQIRHQIRQGCLEFQKAIKKGKRKGNSSTN